MDSAGFRFSERGFSLTEVMVSVGLLTAVSLSVAQLFAVAVVGNLNAKGQTSTAILATQKMEQLRGLTWGFDQTSELGLPASDTTTNLSTDPPSPGGWGLNPSPTNTLDTNMPGYVDYLDATASGWATTRARHPIPLTSVGGRLSRCRPIPITR